MGIDMQTVDASTVSRAELEKLEAVAQELPEGSSLRSALSNMSDTVRAGCDVVVAPESDHVSPATAARILGVSRTHLYKVMDSGDLPATPVGRDRRISLRDLREYLVRQDQVRKHVAERFAHPDRTRRAALDRFKNGA
jgi:excisionase family DNA binding protein